MKTSIIFTLAIHLLMVQSFAQVGIKSDGSLPDGSAMLDVDAPNRGILIPRMLTANRNSIPSPPAGLLIYNTTTGHFDFYNGSGWYQMERTVVSSTTGTLTVGGGLSINASPGTQPANSAMLDIDNPSRGILLPRTTTGSVVSPATGLILYNTSTNLLNYYNGTQWIVPCATSTGSTGAAGNQAAIGVAINTTNSSPHHAAMIDVTSTNKGLLIPRNTSVQRNAILPVTGLTIYNTTANTVEYFDGTAWFQLIPNIPASPAEALPVPSGTQIVWKWKSVPGATGYKWNTVSDYTSAVDMETDTTKTETGLIPGNTYERFVWAYTPCGNSAPTLLTATLVYIGQAFGGGVVFYINGSGQHGLISATIDQSPNYISWGCYGTEIGGTSTAFGAGQANTTAIVNGCSTPGIPARLCDELVLGGYSDWYMPSKDELDTMFVKQTIIGGFGGKTYWCSSENGGTLAWVESFIVGTKWFVRKKQAYSVRAIRSF
jgi:hypothetical protein